MMIDIIKEIKDKLASKGLSLTDIKCLDLELDRSTATYNLYDENTDFDVVGTSKYEYNIPINSTQEDIDAVFNAISLTPYDNSYGTQELFGIVWMNNGDWLERHEYDGSEWWEYKTCPDIPEHLQQENPYKDYDIDSELPKLI